MYSIEWVGSMSKVYVRVNGVEERYHRVPLFFRYSSFYTPLPLITLPPYFLYIQVIRKSTRFFLPPFFRRRVRYSYSFCFTVVRFFSPIYCDWIFKIATLIYSRVRVFFFLLPSKRYVVFSRSYIILSPFHTVLGSTSIKCNSAYLYGT